MHLEFKDNSFCEIPENYVVIAARDILQNVRTQLPSLSELVLSKKLRD